LSSAPSSPVGRLEVEIESGSFAIAEHEAFLAREATGIAAFRAIQAEAFAAERAAWAAAGEFAVPTDDLTDDACSPTRNKRRKEAA